jgi:hypothetical protein
MTILFADDEFSGILNVADQEVTPHKDYVTIGLVGECGRGTYMLQESVWWSLL